MLAIPEKTPTHFFISYTSADQAWAEWVAWQLEDQGYSTVLQAWDFRPGSNFVLGMQAAAAESERTIIILSASYLASAYAQSEWAAAFAGDPVGKNRKLVPVRVAPCQPGGLLAQVVYIDLIDLDEETARTRLLARLKEKRGKPLTEPGFPGGASRTIQGPRPFPGGPTHLAESLIERPRQRRFVHGKVTTHGLLDLTPPLSPYAVFRDATDPIVDSERRSNIFAYLWFPTSQYIRSSPLQALTPVAAICVTNPEASVERLKAALSEKAVTMADIPPSRMRNEEKEDALMAVSAALHDSFIAAVTVPDLIIAVGRNRPDIAYQAMIDLFLLPLIETHRRLDFVQFHARIASVGDSTALLVASAKKALKASYTKKGSGSVEIEGDQQGDLNLLFRAARIVAWAVGAFYNSGHDKWVSLLEQGMNETGE
jgi:hypothetical protein